MRWKYATLQIAALHLSLRPTIANNEVAQWRKVVSLNEFLVGLIYGTIITTRAQRVVCQSYYSPPAPDMTERGQTDQVKCIVSFVTLLHSRSPHLIIS